MNMELSGRRKPSLEKFQRTPDNEPIEHSSVGIGLNAAIVAVADNEPVALVVRGEADSIGATDILPFGPFNPREHRTLEGGLGLGFTIKPVWTSVTQSSSTHLRIAGAMPSTATRHRTSSPSGISH